jgi:hypothetical protein
MSIVPSLPSARQRTRGARVMGNTHTTAQENLTRAFMTFTQAAGSLEKSYTELHAEVARLHEIVICFGAEKALLPCPVAGLKRALEGSGDSVAA